MTIRFNRAFEFRYGMVERLSPLVRRVVARNPGPFTFHGTSTFIIGNREVAVIDPGPASPAHIDAVIDGLRAEKVTHIIATHTHADHSPGCALLQEKTAAPTYGFGPHIAASNVATNAATNVATNAASNLQSTGADRDFVPDHRLGDGDSVAGLDWHLRAVHTPGHCANHICLALPEENTLFCGDQLMAWASTAVLPPDGDVADYLASLEKLKRRPETRYRPTHGAAIEQPRAFIEQVIAHRLQRVEQVFDAVADGCVDIQAMRARIYLGLDSALHSAAERSILGALQFLVNQGRVAEDGAGFRAAG
ncbi:MAG: MBL fold metallo-hydrolase [Gammaproteobacteria bacterium]|nr:MBL fold metallo-hydrolase [Gammaproteobacteria bacterium]